MTTGAFWTVTDPKKPYCEFDPNGKLDIPWDWTDFLTGEGTTLVSYSWIYPDVGLTVASVVLATHIIKARVQADGVTTLVAGSKYRITSRIIDSAGQQWDQTLSFKIREY